MSVWKPENAIEAMYIGAHVWCRWRHDLGKMGAGEIYGFIWDTDNNGCIIQFDDGRFLSRYFIGFKKLEEAWQRQLFVVDAMDFVRIVPQSKVTKLQHVQVCWMFKRGRRRIPVWSQYWLEEKQS